MKRLYSQLQFWV